MRIARHVRAEVETHARHGFPHEVCGVLLGQDGDVRRAVPVANQADDPSRRFAIAPEDLLRIQREARDVGLEVIGYYHSHPRHPAAPSPADLQQAREGMPLSDGMRHLIVSVADDGTVDSAAWLFVGAESRFVADPWI